LNYLGGNGKSKLIKKRANQYDTIRTMKNVAFESAKNPFFKNLINRHHLYNDPNRIKKIFDFAFENTFYEKDNPTNQTIRSGIRSLKDKKANCVDYCILLSSFFINLGIPHNFKMVATDPKNPANYNHIFVTLADGTPLDCVIGQDQTGKEQYKKIRKNYYGVEVPYSKQYTLKII
jgi:hypothetical protein